jgi:hypothetical protein
MVCNTGLLNEHFILDQVAPQKEGLSLFAPNLEHRNTFPGTSMTPFFLTVYMNVYMVLHVITNQETFWTF